MNEHEAETVSGILFGKECDPRMPRVFRLLTQKIPTYSELLKICQERFHDGPEDYPTEVKIIMAVTANSPHRSGKRIDLS